MDSRIGLPLLQGRALAVKRQRAVPACENNPVIDAFLERDTRSFGQHKTVENKCAVAGTGCACHCCAALQGGRLTLPKP